MWAFMCGVVSSGVSIFDNSVMLFAGIVLAGPLVCGMSQAVNDWYDRHVDAINEPDRPIPSGRVPGRWGLFIGITMTALSLALGWVLGIWVFGAAIFGVVLAWIYSAPPLRLKLNGWWGNGAVAICYEGLPWFTGAAVMLGTLPSPQIIALALLYSLGAHGIMTLNDFKAIEGDREMGVKSLPVMLGMYQASRLACVVMAVPQMVVVGLLFHWGLPVHAAIVGGLLAVQFLLMWKYLLNRRTLSLEPRRSSALYNATGTTLYVIGMLVSAFGLSSQASLAGGL